MSALGNIDNEPIQMRVEMVDKLVKFRELIERFKALVAASTRRRRTRRFFNTKNSRNMLEPLSTSKKDYSGTWCPLQRILRMYGICIYALSNEIILLLKAIAELVAARNKLDLFKQSKR